MPLPYFDVDWGDFSLDTDDGLTWNALNANGWTAGPFTAAATLVVALQ